MLPTSSDTRIAASRLNTMKAKNRVTLRKIASIRALLRVIGGVFPGPRRGKSLSSQGLLVCPTGSTAVAMEVSRRA